MGRLSSLAIVDSGFGYATAPSVTISLPDADSQDATAIATLTGLRVTEISLVDSGLYYVDPPTITISEPTEPRKLAFATLTMDSDGSIAAINMVEGGSYYIFGAAYAKIFYDNQDSFGSTFADSIQTSTTVVNGRVLDVTIPDIISYGNESIVIDSATGAPEDFVALATATVGPEGKLTEIAIVNDGYFYVETPTVTIDPADGTRRDYRAVVTANLNIFGQITDFNIVDSGGGYLTAPTVTISGVTRTFIEPNDPASQTLASGVTINAEVSKYSDSDGILHLIHVGADDGNFHTFTTDQNIVFGSNPQYTRPVLGIEEDNKISATEQNDYFDTLTDFLDFAESNPFGEPT